jgi:tetratricopeptide (TPR) repeat protein
MKRRLNLKFFFCLLSVVAVFATSVHLLHGFQVTRNAGALLTQADRAQEDGDLSKAARYLNRYLNLVPDDDESRAKYALLLADEKLATSPNGLLNAFLKLEGALLRTPERHDLRRKIIHVAMHPWLQRYNDAIEHIDRLEKLVGMDGELFSLRGRCHEATARYKKARQDFELALKQPQKDLDDYWRLAYLMRRHSSEVKLGEKKDHKGKVLQKAETVDQVSEKADAVIASMLQVHAKSFRGHLYAADYLKDFQPAGEPAKALAQIEEHIRKAEALAPEEADVLLKAAELEQDKRNYEQARSRLCKGVARHPEDWRMYQALAHLEVVDGKSKAAKTALGDGLKKLPENFFLLWHLAHLLAEEGANAEAAGIVDRLAKVGCPRPNLDYFNARLLVNEEKWLKAARLLEQTYPLLFGQATQKSDWLSQNLGLNLGQECNLLLAGCYEQMGDPARAAAAYGRVIARNPQAARARLGLARMEWHLDRRDAALREYQLVMQMPKAPAAAWLEAARLLIERNLRSAEPDWAEVSLLLDQAATLRPVPPDVALLRAEVLAAQSRVGEAAELLLKEYPDKRARPVEIWVGLSVLSERREKADEVLALLQEAEHLLGDRVELRLARAGWWVRRGGPQAVQALRDLEARTEQFKRDERHRLWRGLAVAFAHIGEKTRSKELWLKLAAHKQTHLESRMMLFDLALQDYDDKEMLRLVDEIQGIEGPEGTLWRSCKAFQRIRKYEKDGKKDKKDLDEATALLAEVSQRRPNWPRIPLAQAQIRELRGNVEAAIALYQRAVLLGEQKPAVIRHVVQLLSGRGRFLEADKMIQTLKEQNVPLGELNRVAAEVALWKQDTGLALQMAQSAVSADSKDYRDQIWLGQMRWAAGKNTDAEAAFRKAIALAEQAPEGWLALAQFLTRTGDKGKAEELVAQAQKKLKGDKALLALAQCHELIGQEQRAKELYEKALSAQRDDTAALRQIAYFHLRRNQPAEAKKYLERLVDLKSGSPQEKAQARRTLALVLASSGDYQQSKKALELLGFIDELAKDKEFPAKEDPVDQRAKLAVLARQKNPVQRREAVAILEDLLRRQLLTPDERFLLAQLYQSQGNWPKEREQIMFLVSATQQALEKQPKDQKTLEKSYAYYLGHAIQGLLKHKSLDEAQLYLTKLEGLEPDSLRTLTLKVRLLFKQKRSEEAVPLLVARAEKDSSGLVTLGGLLEEMGRPQEAEKVFQKYMSVSKRPERLLPFAAFLARQKRIPQALDLCEQAGKTCDPELVASVCVAILYSGQGDEKQCQQVARWLEEAIAKASKKAPLLGELAAVRRLQKDYPAVVSLYRQVLELEPNDTLSLNNLAWLLALKEGNGSEALKLIQRAIDIEGPLSDWLATRAVVYLTLGQSREAIKDLETAIAEAPTPDRHFHLARAHLLASNRNAARDAFRRARELGLSENEIDPLEISAYRTLQAEFGQRQ